MTAASQFFCVFLDGVKSTRVLFESEVASAVAGCHAFVMSWRYVIGDPCPSQSEHVVFTQALSIVLGSAALTICLKMYHVVDKIRGHS